MENLYQAAKYKGECIFVDHGTGYVHVKHQLGFFAVETIRAKQSFESMAFEHGVVVQSYFTNSGACKANAFVRQIRGHGQHIRYFSANAHNQNGVAGRSSRTILQHIGNQVSADLCGQWLSRTRYVTTTIPPNAQNLCPADLFAGSTVPRHRLRDLHIWGCPVNIMDPALQAVQTIPTGHLNLDGVYLLA
jgi:hypothetical protein